MVKIDFKEPSRMLLFGGAGLLLILAFMPWYESTKYGFSDSGFDGAYSATAVICGVAAVAAAILPATGKVKGGYWKFVELGGAAASLLFVILYISENSGDIHVRGKVLESGIQTTAFIGLIATIVMVAGSALALKKSMNSKSSG